MRMRNSQDLLAGLLFVLLGMLAIVVSARYPMGTAQRMGPGYVPTLLGWGLVILGLAIAGRALRSKGGALPSWSARPVLLVGGAIVAFALLLERAGLVLSTLALVAIGSLAAHRARPGEAAVLYLSLVLLGAGLFVYALGLPIRLW